MRIALIDPELAAMVRKAQESAISLLMACADGGDLSDYTGGTQFSELLWELEGRAKGRSRYLSRMRGCCQALAKAINENNRAEATEHAIELMWDHLWGMEQELDRYASRRPEVDQVLLRATDHHLVAGRFQDAIRAAFPVLTERLRQLKPKHKARDGQALVNELFGSNGHFVGKLETEELDSIRSLLAGLYGMIRNWHGHNAGGAGALEAQGVVALLHHLLTGPLQRAMKVRRKKTRTVKTISSPPAPPP